MVIQYAGQLYYTTEAIALVSIRTTVREIPESPRNNTEFYHLSSHGYLCLQVFMEKVSIFYYTYIIVYTQDKYLT